VVQPGLGPLCNRAAPYRGPYAQGRAGRQDRWRPANPLPLDIPRRAGPAGSHRCPRSALGHELNAGEGLVSRDARHQYSHASGGRTWTMTCSPVPRIWCWGERNDGTSSIKSPRIAATLEVRGRRLCQAEDAVARANISRVSHTTDQGRVRACCPSTLHPLIRRKHRG
jgi:hypothetical protein